MTKETSENVPFQVAAFFHAIPDDRFVAVIRDLVHGAGYGFDDVTCTFPNDLDPNDNLFQGVEFWVYGAGEIIVELPMFITYVNLWCDEYLLKHREDALILKAVLENAELSTSQAINNRE